MHGYDFHERSIQVARRRGQAGLDGRIRFEPLDATSYPADGFDLICLLDTLHDLGDPAAALAHARKALAPGGAVLVVEPNAADDYEANLASPLAALSYAASTFQCTPVETSEPACVKRKILSMKSSVSEPSTSRKYSATVSAVRATRRRAPGGSVIWP